MTPLICLGPGGDLHAEHGPREMERCYSEPDGWQCPECQTIMRMRDQ